MWADLRTHLGYVRHDQLLEITELRRSTSPGVSPGFDEVEYLRELIQDEYARLCGPAWVLEREIERLTVLLEVRKVNG